MSARILVVDDILANRRLMQAKLEARYYSVILAENGRQAIERTHSEMPDIILLDVMMPGMDGYQVCRALKADPRAAHIPIVMLTALSDSEDRVRGLEAGADDFLTKPVDDFALLARLGALSRYNAVVHELRQREATGVRNGALNDEESTDLGRGARVLIVDGDERGAQRAARSLRSAGHSVTTLAEAQKQSGNLGEGVDIILLGLSHQPFDPLRLCSHFRTTPSTRAISIIVSCDANDTEKAAKALDIGASDVIIHPVTTEELLARVKTQIRRSRYVEILRSRVDRGLQLSVIDQLTGLYNRRYMMNALNQWMRRAHMGGRPVSVMAADIDHFKRVNDTHGHQVGDVVLRDFAERLKANVRPKDIVCRPGGEEFLVIMPETDGRLAEMAGERIRSAVADEPFEVDRDGISLKITVSAGVSTWGGEDDTASDLLKRADDALYQAKSGGRNRVINLTAAA